MAPVEILLIILIPTCIAIICLFFAWFFSHQAKSKERLMLIEKGIDITEFYNKTKSLPYITWRKTGIVVIGFGIAYLVSELTRVRVIIDVVGGPPSGIRPNYSTALFFIIIGASIFIAHFADRIGKVN
jgi:hypothetical protein